MSLRVKPAGLLLFQAAVFAACCGSFPHPAAALFGKDKELQAQLDQARQQIQQLEQARINQDKRVKELESQYTTLSQEHQQIVVDRDNLLAQVKQTQAETHDYDQVKAERELLERLLRKASEEERILREQFTQQEAELHALKGNFQEMALSRDTLSKQLAESKQRSKEKQLTKELDASQKEYNELSRALKADQRELAESQKRETSLMMRLTKAQRDYTLSVAENSKMRREGRTVPKDVTKLAREHERLIKEAADMHYNLGVLFSKDKEYTRALAEFKKVVELRPDDGDAYYNLGVIYAEHLPDKDRAIAHFRRYLALIPDAKDAGWVKKYIASWNAWEAKDRLE